MTSTTLTTRQLNRALLARQMLLSREEASVLEAVQRLAGLQAQLARPPFVGMWTRLEGFRRGDLLSLLERREVVRVTAMRGTLHLISTVDYLGLRGALQPMLTRGMQSRRSKKRAVRCSASWRKTRRSGRCGWIRANAGARRPARRLSGGG